MKHDINYFNNILKEYIKSFFNEYNDVNVFFFDINYLINEILNDCQKYNFKDCKNAFNIAKDENKNINDFFWSDYTHTSFKANEIFAKEIDKFLLVNIVK